MSTSTTETHLKSMLTIAVPLWALKVHESPDHYFGREVIEGHLDVILENGDALMYRRAAKGKPGDANYVPGTAEAFNATAQAIATLAFAPGGVTSFGLHYEFFLGGKTPFENDAPGSCDNAYQKHLQQLSFQILGAFEGLSKSASNGTLS